MIINFFFLNVNFFFYEKLSILYSEFLIFTEA